MAKLSTLLLVLYPVVAAVLLSESAAAEKKVVCYFINWAWYRSGDGKQVPEDIDPFLCTHINYAFATLDSTTLELKPYDSWADIDNNFYTRLTGLKQKNPNLKVLLAIGGWGDSAGDKYSKLVNSPAARKNFIDKVIPFLKKYNFDGLDLDWEYPRCWQGDCRGPASDKPNFALFAEELKTAFNKQSPNLLLTAAVPAAKDLIDKGYDVPTLGRVLDYINVMAYDMRNYLDKKTGHHAQMTARPGDTDSTLNVEGSLNYWEAKGAPANKLIVGIPAYGRSFTLSSKSSNGLDAPVSGPGKAGPLTGEPGFLGFYEICQKIKTEGWTKKRDSKAGPYAFGGDQWTGFDDPQSITVKCNHVNSKGYGGAMVWDLSMDDFRAKCCKVKFPLINTMNYVLRGKGVSAASTGC